MGIFLAPRPFHSVQDFVALVDPRPNLLFSSKAGRVLEIADDPPILEVQLRREVKLGCHTAETSSFARRFRRSFHGAPSKVPPLR
jgi:hypothetical protein